MTERLVAPCYDCGDDPAELRELAAGEHTYHRFRIFGQEVVFCDFCDADFASYYPEYFGLPGDTPGDADYELELIESITDPQPVTDFVCDKCQHRLAFLSFLSAARRANVG